VPSTEERAFVVRDESSSMRTVFHVSSPAPADQEHAMVNVLNMLYDETVYEEGDEVVIVANGGGGVRMFVEATASAPDRVEQLREDGVELYACGNALRGMHAEDDLLAGVEVAPSGSGALARLQDEGYGYVKAP
jgi:intracellular sulfur oxidation DsrE/DsrF family protein